MVVCFQESTEHLRGCERSDVGLLCVVVLCVKQSGPTKHTRLARRHISLDVVIHIPPEDCRQRAPSQLHSYCCALSACSIMTSNNTTRQIPGYTGKIPAATMSRADPYDSYKDDMAVVSLSLKSSIFGPNATAFYSETSSRAASQVRVETHLK
jgi:hypothetical protein